MSILSELKKLTGKQNAKVVSEALPDSTGGGNFVVGFNEETETLDKTWQEIHDAMLSGKLCINVIQEEETTVNVGIITNTGMDYEPEDSSDETSASIPVYTVNFIAADDRVGIFTAKAKRSPYAYPAFYTSQSMPDSEPRIPPTPGSGK